jgi:CubicO group peptidase (beta-lactamase class C family)
MRPGLFWSTVIWVILLSLAACGGEGTLPADGAGEKGGAAVYAPECAAVWQRDDGATTFYEPNPTYIDPAPDIFWAVSAPEDQGLNGRILSQGLDSMAKERSLLSLLVVRNGVIVAERYYNGSAANQSNNVHSVSKSILPALVGIAIEQGRIRGLDQPIYQLLPARYELTGEKRKITVRHLLTMRTGLAWTEDWTEYRIEEERDWVGAILAQEQVNRPGAAFNYSTGDTHLLSAVLTEATGMSTCEFATRYLFAPAGVTIEHWGRDPQGVFSGGYNVYMTPREAAKVGLLQLRNGRWQEQQIIPRWLTEEAAQPTWTDGEWGYGMLWWRREIAGYDALIAWGYGGQFIYLFPELDLMLVMTENTADDHWNIEIDPAGFVRRYLLPALQE